MTQYCSESLIDFFKYLAIFRFCDDFHHCGHGDDDLGKLC